MASGRDAATPVHDRLGPRRLRRRDCPGRIPGRSWSQLADAARVARPLPRPCPGTRRDPAALGGQSRRLRSVLSLLAANQAGELVKARIADGADIPRNTITAYLDVLRSVYLVDELPPWTANLTRREIGRPKAFVADSALALRLNRQAEQQLLPLTSGSVGSLFEAFVAGELLKQRSWSEHDYQLFHFRDRDGAEVDLVSNSMTDGSSASR